MNAATFPAISRPGVVRQDPFFTRRIGLWMLVLPAVFCTAGCSWEEKRAEYAKGVTVETGVRSKFCSLHWCKIVPAQNPCPAFVVHLPGCDIDNSQLSSMQAMRALGGFPMNDNGNMKDIWLKRDGAEIRITYENGELWSFEVSSMENSVRVTVDGKDITFPASKEELLGAFGEPIKGETWIHYFYLPDAPKVEKHL
jgi:hypothetical protein